ncbi:hypothetical protein XU18_4841 [Perkinsela sp. CCAP 1560/4]|nr:hypothetical protein XU18_4841 [Perkinsela sp. CCAP 1560/4]|eukprot:KNH03765.1 hypothetical protein XU18_4841 [Perkinsela sp. CCAP 1560/4]
MLSRHGLWSHPRKFGPDLRYTQANARFLLFKSLVNTYTTEPSQAKPKHSNIFSGTQNDAQSWRTKSATTVDQATHRKPALTDGFLSLRRKMNISNVIKGVDTVAYYRRVQAMREKVNKEVSRRSGRKHSLLQIRQDYGEMFFMQLVLVYICSFCAMLCLVYFLGWFRLQAPLRWLNYGWIYEDYPFVCDVISAYILNECATMLVLPMLVMVHVALRA